MLRQYISRFPQASVLVIGDLILDHYIWGRVSRISPEAPVPVVHVDSESL
ncbi:MAG: D-glycero-beta-D-manno-heptose-7-phosphate kinase, partial [Nitrospirae bacterium]